MMNRKRNAKAKEATEATATTVSPNKSQEEALQAKNYKLAKELVRWHGRGVNIDLISSAVVGIKE